MELHRPPSLALLHDGMYIHKSVPKCEVVDSFGGIFRELRMEGLVVKVTDLDSLAEAVVSQTRFGGHILESAVTEIAE